MPAPVTKPGMSLEDRETFRQGRPYLIGVIALAFKLRGNFEQVTNIKEYFDMADEFVQEFERRNGITGK